MLQKGGRSRSPYLMPERMKLWTNWRWKSRKAISSGETAIIVPAEMTEKLTPDSGAPKMERPTVTGRISGTLFTKC